MRLPEEIIKEAILNADLEIRQRAVQFFAKSYSADISVMPLIIKAVETFGRKNAIPLICLSRDLPQSEDTIEWVVDELSDGRSDRYENYTYNLSMVLSKADPCLLLHKESAILDSQHLFPGVGDSISERLKMLSWDEATCWRELEAFCEEGKDKQYVSDVNLGYAYRIVEAFCCCGDQCEDRIHSVLNLRIDDYHNNPIKWMEPLMVRLAGEIRLDSTVPILVSKLVEDGGDLLNEECARALRKIGTPTVVNAISKVFAKSPHHFRLYATEPLENIHCDLAVEACQDLLHQEKDADIQLNLAYALLSHFSPEGVDEARKLLIGRHLGLESRGLRNFLVETCTIMGVQFPEYDDWKKARRIEKEQHRQRIEALGDDSVGLLKYTLENLRRELPGSKQPEVTPPAIIQDNQRVGRNAPCPCGSGKKFKKCCMNKSSENHLFN